jgi:uncharacterized protein (UPF0333 family)
MLTGHLVIMIAIIIFIITVIITVTVAVVVAAAAAADAAIAAASLHKLQHLAGVETKLKEVEMTHRYCQNVLECLYKGTNQRLVSTPIVCRERSQPATA